ncbi:MAG: hypothetical protein U1D96_06810 [Eubacteriales bacterium]|nr:hypothetical protein [Bacillota bacterium]MBV1727229.1 hypothetical protein [Desulforudis sp.]MDP3050513.1 hypothetical protein [Eubacteriales bacterium]MDQ7788505.1 hypothetical protein [Clostridia bacterium]MBU4532102.1 hypothetical protein [Bacillota bacterium]
MPDGSTAAIKLPFSQRGFGNGLHVTWELAIISRIYKPVEMPVPPVVKPEEHDRTASSS